jgi:hypothetical protein
MLMKTSGSGIVSSRAIIEDHTGLQARFTHRLISIKFLVVNIVVDIERIVGANMQQVEQTEQTFYGGAQRLSDSLHGHTPGHNFNALLPR